MTFKQPIPTIRRDADGVVILDQTLLPHRCAQHRLSTLDEVAHAIRSMQVRGAPLIGATAAYGVAIALGRDAADESLDHALRTLAATRPTAVNLHWALGRMGARLLPLAPSARAEAAWLEAEAIRLEDQETCAAIGRHGLALIEAVAARRPGPVRVMTHCNAGWVATCGAGTALAPVYAAHARGIAVHVLVSETRPRNQGLLTAWGCEVRAAPSLEALMAAYDLVDSPPQLLISDFQLHGATTGLDAIAVMRALGRNPACSADQRRHQRRHPAPDPGGRSAAAAQARAPRTPACLAAPHAQRSAG